MTRAMVQLWLAIAVLVPVVAPAATAADAAELDRAVADLSLAVKARAPERWEAAQDLLARAGREGLDRLALLSKASDHRVRFLALGATRASLTHHPDDAALAARVETLVLMALADEHPIVRDLARDVVTELRPVAAVGVLIKRLAAAETPERQAIVATLRALTRVPIGDAPAAWDEWWLGTAPDYRLPAAVDPETPGDAAAGPSYHGQRIRGRNLVFIVDASLSMSWSQRLERARDELARTLHELPADARFTLLFFAGSMRAWRAELVSATPGNVKSAVAWIYERTLEPSTATYEALAAALAIPEVDEIFLLSDGDPTAGRITVPEQILRAIRADNTFLRVRINTIGFFFGEPPPEYRNQTRDPARTRAFMQALAAENRGRFTEIER